MSKYKGIIATIIAAILMAAGVVFYVNKDKITDMFQDKESVEQPIVDESDLVEEETITIDDILDMRRQEVELRYLDSVYLNMPEVSLIAILMKFGTDMSHTDIAKEYLKHKKNYNDVEFGAEIRDIYEHNKSKEPDEMPEKAKPDTVLPNVSSLYVEMN